MTQAPLPDRPEHDDASVDTRPQQLKYWRRDQIFWSFQIVFWLGIGAAVLGLSRALKPTEPTPWLAMAVRVGTGFVISTAIYLLFETPRLRRLPRRVRWPLMVLASMTALAASMLLLLAGGAHLIADFAEPGDGQIDLAAHL
jgi:drug/metabolite transporter (DMT)-like permease